MALLLVGTNEEIEDGTSLELEISAELETDADADSTLLLELSGIEVLRALLLDSKAAEEDGSTELELEISAELVADADSALLDELSAIEELTSLLLALGAAEDDEISATDDELSIVDDDISAMDDELSTADEDGAGADELGSRMELELDASMDEKTLDDNASALELGISDEMLADGDVEMLELASHEAEASSELELLSTAWLLEGAAEITSEEAEDSWNAEELEAMLTETTDELGFGGASAKSFPPQTPA